MVCMSYEKYHTPQDKYLAVKTNLLRHRAKQRGSGPAPTIDELRQLYREAGVDPLDKEYRLETNKVNGTLYVVKRQDCLTEEEQLLRTYRTHKTKNCRRKGIEFLLTDEDILRKLAEKGLTIYDIGKGTKATKGRDFYQLCRVNDTGNYDETSEFKTQAENIAERDIGNIGKGKRVNGRWAK